MDATLRTDILAHVFECSCDWQIGLLAKCDAPPHIRYGQFLGCRYNDCGRRTPDQLSHRKRFVTGSGRAIDHQVIQVAPSNVTEKLLDQLELHWSAPD